MGEYAGAQMRMRAAPLAGRKMQRSLKDRYEALENLEKLGELNEFRRRKMAALEALNRHLELERLRGLVSSERMESPSVRSAVWQS